MPADALKPGRLTAEATPNRVKELREEKVWTKAELARRAGVAPQTLDNIERGLPTRKDRRLAVARALEKSYQNVFPNRED
jgi:DNA-binding XRE family transcriptional regulator